VRSSALVYHHSEQALDDLRCVCMRLWRSIADLRCVCTRLWRSIADGAG
jgi:hypothetical protein